MDLLVLAAGMGSRFGGLKQIEPVGPNGEFILDYSIFDAIKAGFKRVVFVIKEENLEVFENTIGNRIKKYIDVDYAFQNISDIPISVPEGREKPWGTVQAILCAKDKIKSNFAIINADDFYGRESFMKAYDTLLNLNEDNSYSSVLYRADRTLSENGAVKRGICNIDSNYITEIIESEIFEKDGELQCRELSTNLSFVKPLNTLVSMNMFLFNKSIFNLFEKVFLDFFNNCKDLLKDECLVSTALNDAIKNGIIKIGYQKTDAYWYGITYKEDLDSLKNGINLLIDKNEYKSDLWSENE